jgi:hypothetical protein
MVTITFMESADKWPFSALVSAAGTAFTPACVPNYNPQKAV